MRSLQWWRIAFLIVVAYATFVPVGHAQQCVLQAPYCDSFYDSKTGQTVQNPGCTWINHVYLQSGIFTTSSEGVTYDPSGSVCGVEENGVPCGVRTTTNTCSETAPVTCEPFDAGCLCAPGDPNCGDGGGGGDEPCGRGVPCAYSVGTVLQSVSQASPLPNSVSTLLRELAGANGIYIKAKVALLDSAQGTKSTGTYEYWERGGRYRIRINPGGDYPWSDIAFDGTFTQGKTAPETTELRRGDERLTPLPDGPLALALAPLRINDPTACRLCQLRLADLKNAVAWRHDASEKLASTEGAIRNGAFDAGLGRAGESDAKGRLARLIWPADEKQHRLEVTLDNYQPIGNGAEFPMHLLESLTPTVSVEYTVESLDLSPSIQAETFNLYNTARKIIYTTVAKDGSVHTKVIRNLPAQTATACHPAKTSSAGSK
jgi:hypothetical protein